jgi:hypothetical protein
MEIFAVRIETRRYNVVHRKFINMEEKKNRVAVFIDGENINHQHAKNLYGVATDFGEVEMAKVYAGPDIIDTWNYQSLFDRVLTPTGKNATDIVVCVDMIATACSGDFDVIVIGSADKDFAHAATTIRNMGIKVVGVCVRQAAYKLRTACNRYICLVDNYIEAEEAVIEFISEAVERSGGIDLRGISTLIEDATGYTIDDVRGASWIDFFENRATDFHLVEQGPRVFVEKRPPELEAVAEEMRPSLPCSMGPFNTSNWRAATAVAHFITQRPFPGGIFMPA